MKPSYKFLEHTADVLFQAEAPTLAELFTQCALAVEETQVDITKVEATQTIEITAENKNIENLLFDFLSDLLFYKDAEQLIFSKFEVTIEKNNEIYSLSCKASGEKLDNEKHEPKIDAKAITMHMFEVKQVEDGWKAQVLVDV